MAHMGEPGATLRKVVLSRPVTVQLEGPLHLAAVLRRLRAGEPSCTIFSMPVPDGAFFGASPELLVARHGGRVSCHPLAGTVARGDTAARDADAQRDLARSAKNRAGAPLRGRGDRGCPGARLRRAVGARRALARRLPLGGPPRHEDRGAPGPDRSRCSSSSNGCIRPRRSAARPRADALAFIARCEAGERGYWAGPVGWVGAAGDGEWMIGIRSARLHDDGTSVTLRAGSGIVAGSDPDDEAAETDVKLATVLEAVVPGASAQLR